MHLVKCLILQVVFIQYLNMFKKGQYSISKSLKILIANETTPNVCIIFLLKLNLCISLKSENQYYGLFTIILFLSFPGKKKKILALSSLFFFFLNLLNVLNNLLKIQGIKLVRHFKCSEKLIYNPYFVYPLGGLFYSRTCQLEGLSVCSVM